jgi:CHAD domain-containing protein
MAYRLSIADDLSGTARACAREQLEGAIERLAHADADPVDAVHEARKHLKKARALLRLLRPGLATPVYRAENGALRGAGLALSSMRDADVLSETVAKLAERYAGRLPAADFEQLRAALTAQVEGAPSPVDRPATLTGVLETLRAALARVEDWPLERCGWDTPVAGAARAYARGRSAFATARRASTPEHLHAWRKRAKDLWYHERLLAPAWPAVIAAHGEEAHVLTELLGDDHDLVLLRARLEPGGIALPPRAGADLAALLALLDERRAELRAAAFRLGRRLYAEPPKAFARRLARYVQTARAEQRLPSEAA